ncbi:hypothetical protein FE634_15770 [Nocardioides dongxiaopingii]|uniref:hypothetical protein n=1 Tax=Nocardioides sp. S-1144 TaxID=2582905 RepID=UPI00110DEBF9|nr:hypothetical protein [Nocardioides sp. S-1144]QCW51504.1 hypothetical protein FE634_15770 [Nocardioides sp. S-1144]
MRRRLGPALLLGVLLCPVVAGCGSEDAGTDTTDPGPSDQPTSTATSDPGEEPSEEPTEEPSDAPADGSTGAPEVVEVLHATAAGGSTTEQFVRVDDEQQLADFVAQFSDDAFAEEVRVAAAAVAAGPGTAYAAVAAVGCDVPPVDVEATAEDVYVVVVGKVPGPDVECFAPVTTVAVMSVGG